MQGEEVTKSANGNQTEVPSLGQPTNTKEGLTEESKSGIPTSDTEATFKGKSPKVPAEQEDGKRKENEKKSPTHGRPSEKVREGQKWNDRPRKQCGDHNDRFPKKHNNKSDLISQKESSDPVAIRKQVCTSPARRSSTT